MQTDILFQIIFTAIGGLGIFLIGMKNLSTGLQTVAGDKLRQLIGMITGNRFMAAGIGTLSTVIVQSSSITTVMVVGFVNSGLMTLTQAIGVIMGANVGTTITGWILVINIGKYGLPILGVAGIMSMFVKNEKFKYALITLMGVGMIFFGLELMKDGFKPIRGVPEFEAWFHAFSADTFAGMWKCIAVGAILTMLVQSSSATLGITIGLAATGVIQFETAAALVLGENLGTTITAILVSLGVGKTAKRAAFAHIIFNLFGVLWIAMLFPYYIEIIKHFVGHNPNTMIINAQGVETFPYIVAAIAMVHTGFNVANTLIFLPFVKLMARFLEFIIPGKELTDEARITKLEIPMLSAPNVFIEQSRLEIIKMGDELRVMSIKLQKLVGLGKRDEKLIEEIFYIEDKFDIIQKEITEFLTLLLSSGITPTVAVRARIQLRVVDEIESISDYYTNILKIYLRLLNKDIELSDKKKAAIMNLHNMTDEFFETVFNAYKYRDIQIVYKAQKEADEITAAFKEIRSGHMKRLCDKSISSVLSINFLDFINAYRKIKDHILNIAEVLAEDV